MKITFILVLLGCAALASASMDAAFVPDAASLELKFGSFERFIRDKAPDSVKMWLDNAPSVFDASSHAWTRAITCSKNLADNAAINVYGVVGHARATEHFSKQKQSMSQFHYFTSKPKSNSTVPVPKASEEEAKSKAQNVAEFSKRLDACIETQVNIVKDSVAQARQRLVQGDAFRPQLVIANDDSKPTEDTIISGFNTLRGLLKDVIVQATNEAATKANALRTDDAPVQAFLNPTTMSGSAYCGRGLTCMNAGRCFNRGQCACTPQWTGPRCTVPAQVCHVYQINCFNGGVCGAKDGNWFCACPLGFEGLYCERFNQAALAPSNSNPVTTATTNAGTTTNPQQQVSSLPPLPTLPTVPSPPQLSSDATRRLRQLARRAREAAAQKSRFMEVSADTRVEADVVDSLAAHMPEVVERSAPPQLNESPFLEPEYK